MNKEHNRNAAGLRRSGIVEINRLREEWSALKGTDTRSNVIAKKNQSNILTKGLNSINILNNKKNETEAVGAQLGTVTRRLTRGSCAISEVLRGVVVLVEVGSESRALVLRAALTALGATVVPTWSPLVTHLVWSHGGCRSTRAKARALACRLVSPLWVEACAASGRRLHENTFPAASRPSDLPSPKTLRILLKKAEMENIPLPDLLADSTDDSKALTLRMSTDTDSDSSSDAADTTASTSRDRSRDEIEVETRVNTAPRRPPPAAGAAQPHKKSKRKLFAPDAEAAARGGNDTDIERPPARPTQLTHRERARAERLARKLLHVPTDVPAERPRARADTRACRVILTGMSRSEREAVANAVRVLNGRVQKNINKTTTHVLLGSCRHHTDQRHGNNTAEADVDNVTQNMTQVNNMAHDMTQVDNMAHDMTQVDNIAHDMTQVDNIAQDNVAVADTTRLQSNNLRTVNALIGAARGCRVLYAQWALDSLEAKRWLHHYGYEVPHLKKITTKARVERQALGRMRSEYAYDVFNGMRVRIARDAGQRDAVVQLLSLCGAAVQDGGAPHADCDIVIGVGEGEVSSRWVFDSVAASRMRTTRRYVNKNVLGRSN